MLFGGKKEETSEEATYSRSAKPTGLCHQELYLLGMVKTMFGQTMFLVVVQA